MGRGPIASDPFTVRKTHILCLISFIVATAQSSYAQISMGDLPAVPEGFSWVLVEDGNTALLKPNEWFQKSESSETTLAYFITRENIDELGYFRTGLTFNHVSNVSRNYNGDALRFSIDFILELQSTREVIKEPWADEWSPDVNGVGIRVRELEEEIDTIAHYYLVSNTATDSVRLMIFESPADSWDTDWGIGQRLLDIHIVE